MYLRFQCKFQSDERMNLPFSNSTHMEPMNDHPNRVDSNHFASNHKTEHRRSNISNRKCFCRFICIHLDFYAVLSYGCSWSCASTTKNKLFKTPVLIQIHFGGRRHIVLDAFCRHVHVAPQHKTDRLRILYHLQLGCAFINQHVVLASCQQLVLLQLRCQLSKKPLQIFRQHRTVGWKLLDVLFLNCQLG